MSTLQENAKVAEQFANDHIVDLSREVLAWEKTATLEDGKMRELQGLCAVYAGERTALAVAQGLVHSAAMTKVAQLGQ